MNDLFKKALKANALASDIVPAIGSRVKCKNDCYHETGTVSHYSKNLFGRLLIHVDLDSGINACFYSYEVSEND